MAGGKTCKNFLSLSRVVPFTHDIVKIGHILGWLKFCAARITSSSLLIRIGILPGSGILDFSI